jgi:hypothetical protein
VRAKEIVYVLRCSSVNQARGPSYAPPVGRGYASHVVTEARITCPECGFSKVETMPTNSCQHSYRCEACSASLTPRAGDCCVFCSYADEVCPPRQLAA